MNNIDSVVERLAVYANGSPVSDYFRDFQDVIMKSIHKKRSKATFDMAMFELIAECRHHALSRSRPISSENVLILVHPYFSSITRPISELNLQQKKDSKAYIQNLSGILKFKDKLNADILLYETPLHYAFSTSLLLEERIVDAAYMTERNCGFLADDGKVNSLRGRNLFFAGGYNRQCLSAAISQMKIRNPQSSIYAIDEISINCPIDRQNPSKRFKNFGDILYFDSKNKYHALPADDVLSINEFLQISLKEDAA